MLTITIFLTTIRNPEIHCMDKSSYKLKAIVVYMYRHLTHHIVVNGVDGTVFSHVTHLHSVRK
jgi:hypothetical protein